MCVFDSIHHVSYYSTITVFIFELQALSDLMMLYNEHQEYELEYKEKIYFRVLIVLNGLCIYDVHFKMYVMSKRNPRIFYFCV